MRSVSTEKPRSSFNRTRSVSPSATDVGTSPALGATAGSAGETRASWSWKTPAQGKARSAARGCLCKSTPERPIGRAISATDGRQRPLPHNRRARRIEVLVEARLPGNPLQVCGRSDPPGEARSAPSRRRPSSPTIRPRAGVMRCGRLSPPRAPTQRRYR